MTLERVTITGADDLSDIEDMLKLSEEFPFVEWGILVGSSTMREKAIPRFPSRGVIAAMCERFRASDAAERMQLSLHLCGMPLEIVTSRDHDVLSLIGLLSANLLDFQRVQLNFHGEERPEDGAHVIPHSFWSLSNLLYSICGKYWTPEIIFQLDGVNDDLRRVAQDRGMRVSGLFDTSHGAGISPTSWPSRIEGLSCGYAGGLGPDNLESQLRLIDPLCAGKPYWVDMETHVRSITGVGLDFAKVRKCLEIAAPYSNRY